jgi:hypothetical protein
MREVVAAKAAVAEEDEDRKRKRRIIQNDTDSKEREILFCN